MSQKQSFGAKSLRSVAHDAMVRGGLLPDFSAAVQRETDNIHAAATASAPLARDLRGLVWFSIDNDDSRDLDQLTAAETRPGGETRVLVAIADVDAIVKKGSAIDAHASNNTTSVYTAAGTFPMLPEKLSTDLTSLGEGVERLAIVADMIVRGDGTVTTADIYRATVLNKAKLAYNSVAAWLDGTGAPLAKLAAVEGLADNIRLQDRIAKVMRTTRQAHGALQLDTLEARPVYEGETLVDISPDARNRAKDLIEDFMIAANGVSARYLDKKGLPSLRRVLKAPERWNRIVELASKVGYKLPDAPDATALDAFLQSRHTADPEHFPDLSLSVIKLLGSGEYALEIPGQAIPGHFALAVRDYTHSTAPNRRFPDLITQRLLKAAIAGAPVPYTNDELALLATHCTVQEDSAKKVERRVQKSAAALLLAPSIGQSFDGIVTGASDKGTWVRISRPSAEGKVVKGFEGLDVSDHARVQLLHTDVANGFIDFAKVP
jgi:VacB/RNase II family 3'-5' exoribonuclease